MSAGASRVPVKATRCVIWHPRRQPVDAELIGALRAKSIELSHRADNEFAAFAALCTLAKSADAAHTATVLLIVEPKSHPAASQLAKLLQRYPLHTTLWVYDRTTTPRLRAASPRDLGEPSVAAAQTAPKPAEAPKLRLASDEPPAVAVPEATSPAHLLTDEELALLLATDSKKEL